ncbi:cell cycle checkpoint protein rad17 [Quercus suber]|uniref:Cell cycle checkpoint protein rad17 n=1 Tax=Quercus suber TaxID=58331 RepID=A0AAW0L2I2_QUESU
MGKRNNLVVLSSDDEENERSLSSNRSYSKPKSRSLVTRSNPNPRGAKKARISNSRSRLSKESSNVNEIGFLYDDFDEVFNGFKVSAGKRERVSGFGGSNANGLWVDKYKPRSLEELAVHKKKVEEVKVWFEERLTSSKDEFGHYVLVITGQAGVGKSATIHVIASHLGARICEWNTPTPVIWQEHLHNSSAGITYTSKLDEFEIFVERIRKYGLIPSSSAKEPKSSNILLIDDLPMANGKVAFGRLKKCLHLLVRSTRIPTAILLTDYGEADSADQTARCSEELKLYLESAGACKVAFNPITNNSIKKTLSRICRLERFNVTAEQIDLIAKASGGDIRNAITSLQFCCLKPDPLCSLSLCDTTTTYLREKSDEISALDGEFSLKFGRDETLSLFHALGKFLHNKRETENATVLMGTIIAKDEAWTEYIRGHPDAETLKHSGCPIYKELCLIFSESAANGKHDLFAEDEGGSPSIQCADPLSMHPESMSDSDEVDDIIDDHKTTQPTTPCSTANRKRGRKGMDDVIAGAIMEMAAASKLRTAAMLQCNARHTIADCIRELDEMQGVDEKVYLAALDLFNKPNAREIFLSLKGDKRLIWLHSKCAA